MVREKNEQEKFWEGEFGREYIERNRDDIVLKCNESFFSRLFQHMAMISSVIEFGANIGMNLKAIRHFLPDVEIAAIETNAKAAALLKDMKDVTVYHQSIYDFIPKKQWDFVLIKTVLIHIPPKMLPLVYDLLVKSSKCYICVAEYYNPTPTEVEYRGHEGKLFKRDFVGEMLDAYPELQLLDYGFLYNRDPYFPYGDINWFLLEKKNV
ncbi:MAG: hypothetical protein KAR13_13225 [Desulfobulbaceae bacterium]|nr:hypothetical protein [Desulfobulbaceae bacterium]